MPSGTGERDNQVLTAAKLQHKFRFRLREHRRLHRRAFTARRGRPPAVATEGSVTTASAVICKKTSSSERRPDCSDVRVASRSRRKHARSARRVGVTSARTMHPPGRTSAAVVVQSERFGEDDDVKSRVGGEDDLVDSVVAGEVGWRSQRREPTAVDDGDAVAQRLRFVHRMCREQYRHTAGAERSHKIPCRRTRVRVHAGGRLIEKHDAGTSRERGRQRQALRLTAREAPYRGARRLSKSDEVEQRVGILGRLVVRGEQPQQLEGPQARIQPTRLQHDPDLGTQTSAVPYGIEAKDPHCPRIGPPVPFEDLDGRGFPGAVRAEQTEDLARAPTAKSSSDTARVPP